MTSRLAIPEDDSLSLALLFLLRYRALISSKVPCGSSDDLQILKSNVVQ